MPMRPQPYFHDALQFVVTLRRTSVLSYLVMTAVRREVSAGAHSVKLRCSKASGRTVLHDQ
jgi:hypothetical protein